MKEARLIHNNIEIEEEEKDKIVLSLHPFNTIMITQGRGENGRKDILAMSRPQALLLVEAIKLMLGE